MRQTSRGLRRCDACGYFLNQVGHVLRCGTPAQRRRARISIGEWGADDERGWQEALAKGMNPDGPTRLFCGKLRRVATRPLERR